MKIRITQAGWETYTGHLAGMNFVGGVAEDVTARQAAQIGNIIKVENLDTGKNTSDSQAMIDQQGVRMTGVTAMPARYDMPGAQTVTLPQYTREALEKIATEKGINGLREIGNPLNVKSTSIPKLIEAILSAQKGKQREADQAAPVAVMANLVIESEVPPVAPVEVTGVA